MNYLYMLGLLGLAAYGLADETPEAQAASALFEVDFTTNNVGGCGYVGEETMQKLMQDALNLAIVGQTLVEDYGNGVGEARRLLDSFFKVNTKGRGPRLSTTRLATISNNYNAVQTFLTTIGAPVNGGESTQKPYLFCSTTWLERYVMTDVAFDKNGAPATDKSGTKILRINEVEELVKMQKAQQDVLGKEAYPYWSSFHHAYVFDKSYGDEGDGFCSIDGNNALTQNTLSASSISLCPSSFVKGGSNYIPLGGVSLQPVAKQDLPKCKSNPPTATCQNLNKVEPTAATLFHELFHLVLGHAATLLLGGKDEIYGLFDPFPRSSGPGIVGLLYQSAIKNPESYTLAAIAYGYTSANVPNDAGQKVEFFSGFATQG